MASVSAALPAGHVIRVLPAAARLNRLIYTHFIEQQADLSQRRTHCFNGRCENIYIPLSRLPALAPIIQFACEMAAQLLACSSAELRCGFWFNYMQPGQSTQLHCHDEDDELLSGVYYIAVPKDSGALCMHTPAGLHCLTPQAGQLILFAADLLHEVTPNRSAAARLSLGLNFGPANSAAIA